LDFEGGANESAAALSAATFVEAAPVIDGSRSCGTVSSELIPIPADYVTLPEAATARANITSDYELEPRIQ
jgi:hypothetical protein